MKISDVNKRIKDIREDRDLTQKQVAEKLNIKQQQYSEYERGLHTIPLEYFIPLCQILHISADYILGLSRDMPYPER